MMEVKMIIYGKKKGNFYLDVHVSPADGGACCCSRADDDLYGSLI
jgi:hypothetical protein